MFINQILKLILKIFYIAIVTCSYLSQIVTVTYEHLLPTLHLDLDLNNVLYYDENNAKILKRILKLSNLVYREV